VRYGGSDDAADESGKANAVRKNGRQRDRDDRGDLGNPRGDLDQAETDRVELGITPERPNSNSRVTSRHLRGGGVSDRPSEGGFRLNCPLQ
jgi:hypothetical protein